MNVFDTAIKGWKVIVALPLAASVLSGCGGGSAYEQEAELGAGMGRATMAPRAGIRPPNQGDFNSDIWNEHHWYECDCSRDPSKPLGS